MKNLPKIIAILGPTASGKTGISLDLARKFNGEIVAVDSRTLYQGMNIGTAKPDGIRIVCGDDKDDKQSIAFIVEDIPHWGIDILDIDEDFNVAEFKKFAEKKIEDILNRGKLPILVGGTGLYFSAIIDNLSFTDVKPDEELREVISKMTNDEIIDQIEALDYKALDLIDVANRRRLERAFEILKISGEKLSDQKNKGEARFNVLQIAFDFDREKLYNRINLRVDSMIANGLIDEVRELKERYGCDHNSMTGIGYRQICAFLDGYLKLEDAIDLIKRDTRHYAKRQVSWFKRDDRIVWIKNNEQGIQASSKFL